MKPLRIGTRGSKLALWQAGHIRERLERECGWASEMVIIKTSGDKFESAAVAAIGGKGIFIKEIEDALLDRRIDLAVHSMKDVPTETPRGLLFPAITEREDPRDCLISRRGETLQKLPQGACIGTSSLRRQSQLRYFRPDLRVADMRGNVDTRLRKVEEGGVDAIVVAKAGLDRLGFSGKITEVISAEIMVPAVGQGALAIEMRDDASGLHGDACGIRSSSHSRGGDCRARAAGGTRRRLPGAAGSVGANGEWNFANGRPGSCGGRFRVHRAVRQRFRR